MQIQQYKGRTLTFQITNPPNTNCFVYCLSEVDGPIRYVGKTEKGLKRIQQHLSEKKKRGKVSHKANWINKLRDTGLLLEVSILEEVSSEVINEAEVFYISYFKSLGFDLTNKTEGGEGLRGYKHSNETRILMSEVGKGKKHSPLSEKELEKIRERSEDKKYPLKKALIFTESTRTQIYVKEILEKSGYAGKIVLFNGSNNDPESRDIYQAWLKKYA